MQTRRQYPANRSRSVRVFRASRSYRRQTVYQSGPHAHRSYRRQTVDRRGPHALASVATGLFRSYRRQTVDQRGPHALASVATDSRATDLPATDSRAPARRGLTLVEVLTVMIVLSILLSMSVSPVRRTVEQTHADIAGAGLRSVYNAQRFYWLENRSYADSIVTLRDAGLIDADYLNATEAAAAPPRVRYHYEIVSADATSFVAQAVRRGSDDWTGNYQIDQTGAMTGTVSNASATSVLTPGF